MHVVAQLYARTVYIQCAMPRRVRIHMYTLVYYILYVYIESSPSQKPVNLSICVSTVCRCVGTKFFYSTRVAFESLQHALHRAKIGEKL